MSRTPSNTKTAFVLPVAQPTEENDHLPTMDRPAVVAYAASLGVPLNERYVREASQSGLLSTFKIRNRCLYSRASVRLWLASLESKTA